MRSNIFTVLFFCLAFTQINIVKADYSIYPIPQKVAYNQDKIDFEKNLNVVIEDGIDQYTIARLKEIFASKNSFNLIFSKKPSSKIPNLYLGIRNSGKVVDKYVSKQGISTDVFSVERKYDRHIVYVRKNSKNISEIIIIGEHTNAVYYGLATMEQILEQGLKKGNTVSLQSVFISDYADMQYRGIVEGYYGYPYSYAVKKDLMNFFKRYKMNTYIYGAKSDPFHSGYWRDAYPENITTLQEKNGWLSQDMIKDLSLLSLQTKVNFIWAIHPNSGNSVDFSSVKSTNQAVKDVMNKFEKMHKLGIRQFSVFLDDAGWDFDDVNNYRDFLTNLQCRLQNKYNLNYTNPSDTVLPIHYVPHIYAINFAKKEDLKTYFDAISQTSSNIVVYTTGSGVWSSVKNEDFSIMKNLMKRPVALWWNYPCNDNKDGRIYTSDMYSNLKEMGLPIPDKNVPDCIGLVSNPMQQGTVAKIGLFGVADYSWNTEAFDAIQNWKDAFTAIIGKDMSSTYNFLSDYLRFQDTEEMHILTKKYMEQKYNSNKVDLTIKKKLLELLNKIKSSSKKMLSYNSEIESDRLLISDLKPWLVKLKKMAEMGITLISLEDIKDENVRWNVYCEQVKSLNEFRTDIKYMVDALEGMGENPPSVLHRVEPSHKYLMPFIEYLIDNAYVFKKEQSFNMPILYHEGIITEGHKTEAGEMYLSTTITVKNKDTLLIEFPKGGTVEDVIISPMIFKNFIVSTSLFGKHFTNVFKEKQVIGERIKYLKLIYKSAQTKSLTLDETSLNIKMASAPLLSCAYLPPGDVWNNHNASLLIDGNYNTFTCLNRDQKDGDVYTVKLATPCPLYDVTVAFGTTNLDFPKVATIRISEDSTHWTDLKIENTDITEMRMSMPQVIKHNDDVSLCSFDANGETALYISVCLKEAFQEKWLRLNEIEVNPKHFSAQFIPKVSVNGKENFDLADGKAHTCYTPITNDDIIVYNMFSIVPTKQLIIYAAENLTGAEAEIYAISENNTTKVGVIRGGVNKIDLTGLPYSSSIKINVKDKGLSISEIVEQ